jgi:signal recognition particle GTPase
MKLSKMGIICFLFCLSLILVPASGWTQGQEHQSYEANQQASQIDVSKEEVTNFAEIQNQFNEIQQNYKTKLSGIQDQEKRQKLVEEMNEKMVEVVQNKGLSVERYNEIFNAVQSDPELRQKIMNAGGSE